MNICEPPLNLDDDVKQYLDYEANRTGKGLGKITSEIIRDSQRHSSIFLTSDELPTIPRNHTGKHRVTSELIEELSEQW